MVKTMVASLPSDSKPSSTSAIVSARLLGSTCSGLCELMIFHPVDTIAKRLMTNKEPVRPVCPVSRLQRSCSLKRLGFAAGYKVSQRIYKFGGQPVVNDYMATNHAAFFRHTFGDRNAKTMMHASAGSLIGMGEIALLPLDVLKIRAQTNPAAIAGKGVGHIFKMEGFALYRGAAWTAARNAPGSFALFGGSAVAKEYIFQLEDYSNATFFQNFVSSISGASASIIGPGSQAVCCRAQARVFVRGRSAPYRVLREGFYLLVNVRTALLLPKAVHVGSHCAIERRQWITCLR
uniref:Mitochondrial carrier protein n=1 Tax=Hyaloperonospora arabidopsidis (strain Emoy2) TaxID=559515 RepID=M4C3K4_HYAAE